MKKVLVLVALATLVSTSAFAVVKNSKHDLSAAGGQTIRGTSTEICVYCHTPHGANSALAPLWNRGVVNATAFYNNPVGSMNSAQTLAGVNASDAPLCLSCHDGAGLTVALKNPPNSGGALPGGQVGANSNLSSDLSNDHPIGFSYALAAAPVDAEIRNVPSFGLKVTYGVANNQMWCSSCHDVHDGTNVPFLEVSNTNSNLCLSCHIK